MAYFYSSSKLSDIELLLHGLSLDYLSDIMVVSQSIYFIVTPKHVYNRIYIKVFFLLLLYC